jgi:hypothetical protein
MGLNFKKKMFRLLEVVKISGRNVLVVANTFEVG